MESIQAVLVAKRYDVLETFVQRVRRLQLVKPTVSAADIARPIAACLTWMSRALAGMHTDPMECARLAYEYADDRRRMNYELPALFTEIGLLRSAIVEIAAANDLRDPCEVDRASALVHRFLADAVARATAPRSAVATARMPAFRRTR